MATIQDVAHAAGVSPSTVSRYLSGQLRLTAATEERISAAIRALDYTPHAVARQLATGRSRAIGLILPGVTNPFFAFVAEEVEALAAAEGFSLLLCNTKGLPEREAAYVDLLSRGRTVDGLIYFGMHARNARLGAAIATLPVVVADERIDGVPPVSTVFADNYAGAFAATRHLTGLGHRRIAFVCGPADLMTARERYAGYLAALEAADIGVDPALVYFDAYSEETGRQALAELLARPAPPSALFAAADAIALGVYGKAAECGLHIPDDLSVVGFDDIAVSRHLGPALTTVRQPVEHLSRTAFALLLHRLREREVPPQHAVLPVELVVRRSTAVPSYQIVAALSEVTT